MVHVKKGTPAFRYFAASASLRPQNTTIGANVVTVGLRTGYNIKKATRLLTVLLLSLILSSPSKASDFKFNLPVPLIGIKIGTHNISAGIEAAVSLSYSRALVHLNNRILYNFKATGINKKGFELRIEAGANYLYKSRNKEKQKYFLNNSPFPNQIGYSYIWYFDQFATSQKAGIIRWVNQIFQYEFENDFLAFKGRDKFRTGAVYFAITGKKNTFFLKNINYTGNPYNGKTPIIQNENFKYGYKDMRYATFGDKSVGTLSIGWLNHNYKNGTFGAEIGIDAEQIRNFVQNKLIHDNPLINRPKKGIINPHIPMLAKDGTPFYYAEGQQVRKPKIYLNAFLNNNYLY